MKYTIEDKKYKFKSFFDTESGFYVRTGVLDDNGKDTGADSFMASYPHLIDVGIMGHCIHGKTGLCAKAGFTPKTSFESDSPTAVKNIIGANAGVGFWPEYTWGRVSADVKLLHIQQPVCRRKIVVGLHESHVPSAVAEAFFVYLIEKLKSALKD